MSRHPPLPPPLPLAPSGSFYPPLPPPLPHSSHMAPPPPPSSRPPPPPLPHVPPGVAPLPPHPLPSHPLPSHPLPPHLTPLYTPHSSSSPAPLPRLMDMNFSKSSPPLRQPLFPSERTDQSDHVPRPPIDHTPFHPPGHAGMNYYGKDYETSTHNVRQSQNEHLHDHMTKNSNALSSHPHSSFIATTPSTFYTPRAPQLPPHHSPPRQRGPLFQPPDMIDIHSGGATDIQPRGAPREYSPRPPMDRIPHHPLREEVSYDRHPPLPPSSVRPPDGPDGSLERRDERNPSPWGFERGQDGASGSIQPPHHRYGDHPGRYEPPRHPPEDYPHSKSDRFEHNTPHDLHRDFNIRGSRHYGEDLNDRGRSNFPHHNPPQHHPMPVPQTFENRQMPGVTNELVPPKIPLLGPPPSVLPVPPVAVAMPPLMKPEIKTVSAERIFDSPGRLERPSHIVIILRGLPGSGKSHVARLIKEKETSNGGTAPRILALDSYFLNEVEKTVKDPDTGRRVKKKFEEYEYDEALAPSYRSSLFKMFNKTLNEGFFPMILVDAINHKVCHFDHYWSNAKMKGFEVYVVELMESIDVCVERNVHNWNRDQIEKLVREWEETPPHFLRLDMTPLLSDSNIDEVEMECTNSDEEQEKQAPTKSRWEEASEDQLDKLDAVRLFRKRKRLHSDVHEEEEELSLVEYMSKKRKQEESNGSRKKKRVRWADLEAAKEEQRRKEIGFCIGGQWNQMTEEEAETILLGDNSTSS